MQYGDIPLSNLEAEHFVQRECYFNVQSEL